MDAPPLHWQANHIRFALFTPTHNLRRDIWRQIAGSEPEAEDNRPREGLIRQIGAYKNGTLEVATLPGRIDVAMLPVPALDPWSKMVPSFSFPDAQAQIELLAEPFKAFLSSFAAPITRMAIICNALAESESHEDSYKILSRIISSAKVDLRMKDFLFRVNWRAACDVNGVEFFNRLLTFSAIEVRAEFSTLPGSSNTTMEPRTYASMELDINTPAERVEELPTADRVPIFDSLCRLISENLRNGEVS